MASIVTGDAGEKGQLLRDIWRASGHHSTSDGTYSLTDARVVSFGGQSLKQLTNAQGSLAGKIIVDCGTPPDATVQSRPSRAEALAEAYPETRIVKAFNAISVEALVYVLKHSGIEIGTVYTSGFYFGDDDEVKAVVAGLIAEARLDPIDFGPRTNAPLLQSIALLGRYLSANVFDSWFAITVERDRTDRSPLDRFF